METIELIIFLGLAILGGAMVMYFMIDSPAEDMAEDLGKTVRGEHEFKFKEVDHAGFIEELLAFWKKHRYSDSDEKLVVFYQGSGILDKQGLFETIKSNNLCKTIQSRVFACGNQEDVIMGIVKLPAVIEMRYVNNTIIISQGNIVLPENSSIKIFSTDFGGFVGNGDLVKNIGTFPADVDFVSMELSLMSGSDFKLIINNQLCDVPLYTTNKIDTWNLNCTHLLVPGPNNIKIEFTSNDLFRKYIAGGLLTIAFESDSYASVDRMYLPDIDGMINYFGSVEIPGNPNFMRINLDYVLGELNDTDFYVKVGNDTVFQDKISNRAWAGTINVPLSSIVPGTNPLRIGINSNASNVKEIGIPQPVDVVLITDNSGSMDCDLDELHPSRCKKIVGGDFGDQRGNNCNHPDLLTDQTQKLLLAKCFGVEFSQIILDKYFSNKIGLVSFGTTVSHTLNLTSEMYKLETALMSYKAGGNTCVACAIDEATEMLEGSILERAMVIMTDGEATVPGPRGGDPDQAAIDAAQEAFDKGIALYTIAFGLKDSSGIQLLQDIACIDDCNNFGFGTDARELQRIYKLFADKIAQMQTITTKHVQGSREDNIVDSILQDSSVEFGYTEWRTPMTQLKVRVSKELGCDENFDLPDSMDIESARILAWAGTLWTENININDVPIVDLESYNVKYMFVGDPFVVTIPPSILTDHNNMRATAGDIESENSVCLGESTLQYYATIPAQTYQFSQGCNWNVKYGNKELSFIIPPTYVGDRDCEYTDTPQYNPNDAFQNIAYVLFDGLDFDDDGDIDDTIDRVEIIS